MKKPILLFFLLCACVILNAQGGPRPGGNVWLYLKDGYLDDALEASLELTQDEPT